jgi:NADPH:quinone reductase-like Zn-dependent oxidoreductase
LKVDLVIDYELTRFEEVASNIDFVFDTVGGNSLERSWPLLGTGARVVTIATDSESSTDARTKAAFFIVEPDHEQLAELEPLLEAGYLRPFVAMTASLLESPEAYRRELKPRASHGKTVVVL